MAAVIETLAIAAVSGVAVPIFQSIWDSGSRALDFLGKGLNEQTRQLIFAASQQYAKNYAERHGTLKVLGMREPVSLESVYTTLQILDPDSVRQFESLEAQEENLRQSPRRRVATPEAATQSGMAIAAEHQYLMVLGAPGAGKSTFLKRLGLEVLKGKKGDFPHDCIPVFLELKRFSADDCDFEAAIASEFEISGFPAADSFARKALEQGKLLILLDGLDEVADEYLNAILSRIQDFVDRYASNRYAISCRTGAARSSLPRFVDVAIADFDDRQIEQFIGNWFNSEGDREQGTAQKCWELLQKPRNAAAKELAHTPLLLTFLCRAYDRSQNFPSNRSVLYRKALRILLEEWAAEKRLQRSEIYAGLHAEAEELLLSEIAYQGCQAERFFFTRRELVAAIKTFLTDNLNAPQNLDGEAVLDAIAVQQGILVKRAEGVYSFSHLTLQEYLAAQYIADRQEIATLVAEHLWELHWQDIFVLVAGLLRGGADDLLVAIEAAARQPLTGEATQKPLALLRWAASAIEVKDERHDLVAKRAVAIALALGLTSMQRLARALAPALTRALAQAFHQPTSPTPVLELVQKLEKLAIFQPARLAALRERLEARSADTLPPEQLARQLKRDCLVAFELQADWLRLNETEVQALKNHLYACQLLVRCKQAAARVTPATWQTLEQNLLQVSEPSA